MKTVEEFVDAFKRSEDLQDDVRDIFAEFLLSQVEEAPEETGEDKPKEPLGEAERK